MFTDDVNILSRSGTESDEFVQRTANWSVLRLVRLISVTVRVRQQQNVQLAPSAGREILIVTRAGPK